MYEPPEIIKRVGALLREPISANPKDITKLEALRYELLETRCRWQQLLAEKKANMLYPKGKEVTELDRKVMLNASVANIEHDYEFLVGLERLVSDRLTLYPSLLTQLQQTQTTV